jgi:HPt (histidine-containing phosphotransfer) domain-containing protein
MKSSVIDLSVWKKWRDFEKEEESPGFFLELLNDALKSTPDLMRELEAAFGSNDSQKIFFYAHTLGSTCLTLGGAHLGQMLREIEHDAKLMPPKVRTDLLKPVQKGFADFISELTAERDRLTKLSRAS